MTPQEENEKLAEWAGIECRCDQYDRVGSNRWDYCPRHTNGGLPPDYDRDEVAVSLLPVISGKDINWYLSDSTGKGVVARLVYYGKGIDQIEDMQISKPTIAAAIKKSILVLLEKEAP